MIAVDLAGPEFSRPDGAGADGGYRFSKPPGAFN